jgi:hypothetical protein
MRASMRIVISGAWPARAKAVEHLADAHRLRVGEVERVAVQLRLVRDVVHRLDDEIHRHQVDASALDAEHRHPDRQHLAQLLDEREEVVRPVDLVHLAGLRMPDDHARTVDAPLQALLAAYQCFRIVLGAQVRIVQALPPRRTCLRGTRPDTGPRPAMDEVWWNVPAPMAAARSSACCVPSMFDARCASAFAVRS